ncbi:hypothetical protein ACLHDF_07460 [Priestia aryabhattai]
MITASTFGSLNISFGFWSPFWKLQVLTPISAAPEMDQQLQ